MNRIKQEIIKNWREYVGTCEINKMHIDKTLKHDLKFCTQLILLDL